MHDSKLFTPLKIGNVQVQHRIVMAPLTRYRAEDNHVPSPFAAEYYSQRASIPGTLIITEATFISPQGGGYANVPGISNPAQIKAWKGVTDAVHAKGSFMFMQLWALGRAANPEVLKAELGPSAKFVSSSNLPMSANDVAPDSLSEEEIWDFVGYYRQAALNAIEAGFDGVEIHGANGYLVDQFTQDTANKRRDDWGGSVEKRARFALEVTKAIVEAVGAERTAIRLSPYSSFQGMKMDDPKPGFRYLVTKLKAFKLAYLHLVESRISGDSTIEATEKINFLVDIWGNTSPVFIAGGFVSETALKAAEEYPDSDVCIVFGRYFISNPDLVFRIQKGIQLSPYERAKFYTAKEKDGYTNYPFSAEFLIQSS
jgi:NADPH2 dehydrogenase